MSSLSSFGQPKPSPFDIYGQLMTQFQNISTLNAFMQHTALQPQELMTITNMLSESVTQLGPLSEFFIKKTNDVNVSVSLCEKLQKMFNLHNELLSHIYKFSEITSDMAKNVVDVSARNLKEDVTIYIYFDMIHKYRVILLQIFDCIRRIGAYVAILKDKV